MLVVDKNDYTLPFKYPATAASFRVVQRTPVVLFLSLHKYYADRQPAFTRPIVDLSRSSKA